MTLKSSYTRLCDVSLPYQGRQSYMHSFDLSAPTMQKGFEDYLVPVTLLCKAAGAAIGMAYMTVDEKIVAADASQRRPGPHIDGCFMPDRGNWGQDDRGRWLHYCNDVPFKRMPIIVAASVAGCRAFNGIFDGKPTGTGDLSHIAVKLGEGEILPANVGYLLSPDCVHESMRFSEPTRRTFLRIALPTDFWN